MKISVSLSDEDVALLDAYAKRVGVRSRSAAVQRAIRMLRNPDLEQDYGEAWSEWSAAGEETAWAATTADGLGHAAR
jgi:Arc/MetJ-type ribon-helix-helix transcriptional regulator